MANMSEQSTSDVSRAQNRILCEEHTSMGLQSYLQEK